MDEALRNRLVGEAKFLRAFYYYHLVRLFGDLPLMTTALASLDKLTYPKRATQDLVYTQNIDDLKAAEASGQFVPLDAGELLSRIMLNGLPDHTRFHVIVQGLLQKTAETHPYLHIYGEMVALLWEQGNEKATHLLEELWNNLGRMRPFSLLCGYPKKAFDSEEHANSYAHICNAHSHVHAA